MDTSFSHRVRVAACDRCGAPHEAAIAGGAFACRFCNAQNMLAVRSEIVIAPGRAPTPEAERIARLRQQDGRPLMPPPNLAHLMENGQLAAFKVDEAVSVWNGARHQLRANPNDFDAAERMLFLSMMIAQFYKDKGEKLRQRALLESALDAVTLPRHRQILRGFLTRAAVLAGDLEAAEAWLRPCDAQSDDLSMDSEWRFSRAFIDTAKGNFQGVVTVLGRNLSDVPIEDASDDVCTVLRANALERLGDLDNAVLLLRARFAAGGDARQTMDRVIRVYPDWKLCAQSYPVATAMFATAAGDDAASRSNGSIPIMFIPMGLFMAGLGIWRFSVGVSSFFGAVDPLTLADRPKDLGFGLLLVLVGLLFLAIGWATKKSGDKKRWLHVNGLQATAQVRGAAPTGTRMGQIPVMQYSLLVNIPGRAPYEATATHIANSSQTVLSGIISVRVHPNDPNELVIEADG